MEGVGLNAGFWRGRRVLLTGHTGFKGAWLALWLEKLGAQVSSYALAPPAGRPSLFEAAGVANAVAASTFGDIRDACALTAVLERSEADVIVHMAAQSLVREAYADPVDTFATNVMGTVNLLEAVRVSGKSRTVLVVTSDKCYENAGSSKSYVESDRLGGRDPYSASKACAEIVTGAYAASYFTPSEAAPGIATVRAGNVIGGGDWANDRLIPDLAGSFHRGVAARIRNPVAVRPWQHVLDALAGYLMLAEKLHANAREHSGPWNFGPDSADAKNVAWVADRMASLWGEGARWEPDSGEHPHESAYLSVDATKARSRLGWRPQLSLEEALRWTAEWYRAYYGKPQEARRKCLEQIDRYMGAV